MRKDLAPGYYVFMEMVEDGTFEIAATRLMKSINDASQSYDIEFIGGIQLKMDDSKKNYYLATHAAMLTPKEPPDEAVR